MLTNKFLKRVILLFSFGLCFSGIARAGDLFDRQGCGAKTNPGDPQRGQQGHVSRRGRRQAGATALRSRGNRGAWLCRVCARLARA